MKAGSSGSQTTPPNTVQLEGLGSGCWALALLLHSSSLVLDPDSGFSICFASVLAFSHHAPSLLSIFFFFNSSLISNPDQIALHCLAKCLSPLSLSLLGPLGVSLAQPQIAADTYLDLSL